MLNLSFASSKDVKESARIRRAREYEEERKSRIFNSRNRLIGVDKTALEKQIAEKKARDEEEKAKEEAFYLKLIRDNEIAAQFEKEIEENRRKLNESINGYRLQYQKKEDRREYDLYDPDCLKKSLPCRVLDDDPRLSISGAQKFEGEDMNAEKRQKYQQEQQKAWLQQQIDERLRAEKEKKLAEDAYAEMIAARDQRARQLDALESQCKKQLEEAAMKFNQALAAEQATQKRMQEMRDLEDKRAEIYNAITGDFLTENPNVATSCLGPNRIVGSSYKGMPVSEKEAIRKEQIKQIEENKKMRVEEKKIANEWGELTNYFASAVSVTDNEIMKKQRELTRQLFEQNKLLSLEQRRNREIMNQELKNNTPTEEFFDQFNRTTR